MKITQCHDQYAHAGTVLRKVDPFVFQAAPISCYFPLKGAVVGYAVFQTKSTE